MQFHLAILSLFASVVAATKIDLTQDISVTSRLGKRLLSKARRLANDDEVDYTWLSGYSIQFIGCSSVMQFGGGGENGGNNNEDGQSNLYEQSIVKFTICPTDTCQKGVECSGGGSYVVEMYEFVNAYTEAKLDYKEYMCEQIRENCACDDDKNDDEQCENQCYRQYGWGECIEDEDEDEFDLQEYLQCNEVKFEDNDDDNEYEFWAAPYCSGGNYIYLGLYTDEACTQMAASGTYESIHKYGYSLPYSKESIVKKDCVSCLEPNENQNQNDQQDEDEVIEVCEEVYMMAGKCETNMNAMAYPNTDACEYINDVLPRLEADSSQTQYSTTSNGGAAKTFAFIFFFTTCALLVTLCMMYQNRSRSKVNLSGYEGGGTVA